MIAFKELLKQTNFENFKKALVEQYPDQAENIEGYKKVFKELLVMEPIEKNGEIWQLEVRLVKSIFKEEEDFVDVSGIWLNSTEPQQRWALEFIPWEEWLSMLVNEEQVEHFGLDNYIAHCIWEMTYCGFEQEVIKGKNEELKNLAEEIQKYKEDIKVADFELSSEDILDKINDFLDNN